MIVNSTGDLPFLPVSHDPSIKKQLFVQKGTIPNVFAISHVQLKGGETAVLHSHENAYEIFFAASGQVDFVVQGKPVALKEGTCLVVEPGEEHEITGSAPDTRMFYFLLDAGKDNPA